MWAKQVTKRAQKAQKVKKPPSPRAPVVFDASEGNLTRYLSHWRKLMDLEHEAENSAVTERLHKWPLERLEREGLTLTGLTDAARVSSLFSRELVRFQVPSLSQRQHSFDVGDEAYISRNGPLDAAGNVSSNAVRCEIAEIKSSSVTLALDYGTSASLLERKSAEKTGQSRPWRLDRIASAIAYRRTINALEEWTSDAGPPYNFGASTALRRTVIEGASTAGRDEQFSSSGTTPSWRSTISAEAKAAADTHVKLNDPQRSAVLGALDAFSSSGLGAHNISLIQGPPGTGKSTAAVALLKLAAMDAPGPLLATADSNAAVDQLLEGLLAQGVAACRVGRPSRAVPELVNASVEAKCAAHPEAEELNQQREALSQLRAVVASGELDGKARGEMEKTIKDGWRSVRAIEARLLRAVLEESEVVCATLVGCGSRAMLEMRFPLVVVDECTQASEPRTTLALARAMSDVVLVGDQMQLAPTVLCQEAADSGLSRSLFERMVLQTMAQKMPQHIQHSMLTIQYRMHPQLRAFPSDTFYDGRLTDGVAATDRRPPASFPSAPGSENAPLAFFDAAGREEQGRFGASKLNRREAACIAKVAAALLADVKPDDLGIITPYAAQVAEIRRALRANSIPKEVEVRTVDGFQGREKEVVLFSAVRANRKEKLGFLTDKRRLNVGLTRARRALLVIGCQRTLKADATWHAFLEHCSARGLMLSAKDLAAHGLDLNAPGTMTRTYLNCPFMEKDECKGMGGRFDHERKAWYVPAGAELAPFLARWPPRVDLNARNDDAMTVRVTDEDEILMKEASATT